MSRQSFPRVFTCVVVPLCLTPNRGIDVARPQMRPLASSDYHRGHLDVLSVLTVVGDPGEQAYRAQFAAQRGTPMTYYSVVIVDTASDRVVGVGSVFMERKFLRQLGTVGHIEDIAVDKSQQGKKLGLRIIQALSSISEAHGAYKTILNCSDFNVRACPFHTAPCPALLTGIFSLLREVRIPEEGNRDGASCAPLCLRIPSG
jgi:hypothetical protein